MSKRNWSIFQTSVFKIWLFHYITHINVLVSEFQRQSVDGSHGDLKPISTVINWKSMVSKYLEIKGIDLGTTPQDGSQEEWWFLIHHIEDKKWNYILVVLVFTYIAESVYLLYWTNKELKNTSFIINYKCNFYFHHIMPKREQIPRKDIIRNNVYNQLL